MGALVSLRPEEDTVFWRTCRQQMREREASGRDERHPRKPQTVRNSFHYHLQTRFLCFPLPASPTQETGCEAARVPTPSFHPPRPPTHRTRTCVCPTRDGVHARLPLTLPCSRTSGSTSCRKVQLSWWDPIGRLSSCPTSSNSYLNLGANQNGPLTIPKLHLCPPAPPPPSA